MAQILNDEVVNVWLAPNGRGAPYPVAVQLEVNVMGLAVPDDAPPPDFGYPDFSKGITAKVQAWSETSEPTNLDVLLRRLLTDCFEEPSVRNVDAAISVLGESAFSGKGVRLKINRTLFERLPSTTG